MTDEPKKLSKNREKKAVLVAEISEKVKKAKAMVMTNYQGMTHRQLESLKKALKNSNAQLLVTKNTLLKRSLEEDKSLKSQISGLNFDLPTATLFAYEDTIAPLKELAKSIKALKLPSIKFGIFEGKIISGEDILKLSTLPSREVLLSQFVGNLKGPLYGLHRVLNWNMQKLVLALKAIENSKEVNK